MIDCPRLRGYYDRSGATVQPTQPRVVRRAQARPGLGRTIAHRCDECAVPAATQYRSMRSPRSMMPGPPWRCLNRLSILGPLPVIRTKSDVASDSTTYGGDKTSMGSL